MDCGYNQKGQVLVIKCNAPAPNFLITIIKYCSIKSCIIMFLVFCVCYLGQDLGSFLIRHRSLADCMNHQRLHRANSCIRGRSQRTAIRHYNNRLGVKSTSCHEDTFGLPPVLSQRSLMPSDPPPYFGGLIIHSAIIKGW